MNAIVTSDVHLGSRALDPSPFIEFVRNFPLEKRLILNGDIVNRNCTHLPDKHAEALDLLRELSRSTRVTWIRGNHDEDYELTNPGGIEFVDFSLIEDGVGILHGHDFRHRKLSNRPLVYVLRAIQAVRRHIVSESAAVHYRVWDEHILVRTLRRHIINNAFSLARENDLQIVVCGHIHIGEKMERDGIRYINTGSWLACKNGFAGDTPPWTAVTAAPRG